MTAEIRIGLSGWNYAHWRSVFYPRGWPQRRELEFAGAAVNALEINGSFYSLQRPSSYRRWRDTVPDDVVFAVKGSRYITHLLKLGDIDQALANFLASGLLDLGPKLGPLLWQLPKTTRYDPHRLTAFLDRLPRDTEAAAHLAAGHDDRLRRRFGEEPVTSAAVSAPLRHALEVRSDTFADDGFYDLCRRYDVALVVADTARRFVWVDQVTSDLVYVRLHGDQELYVSGYTDAGIDHWAGRVADWASRPGVRQVHVYFDNDAWGHAPYDARRLAARLGIDRPTPAPLPYGDGPPPEQGRLRGTPAGEDAASVATADPAPAPGDAPG
ncbi:DUF72 domain-containing protein [Nakamurella endophytica]|uniref:DUF72 domain-containing protein n=1 Tax=Nakamurella endophytica TaxID=1748367 RepID=A0A917T731_9ACTN|nr:DUF72 domain-containing protein [Nakamurella endophytica]GGM12341.1 hypothetical protein GCM10011594_35260 [Nakamurella endophytica]